MRTPTKPAIAKEVLNDFDGAIADYSKVIELKPDADFYVRRGAAEEQKGDLTVALADYKKALELRPADYLFQWAVTNLEAKISK
jgi:tetratricopeptide (TPR) repeat protein